MKVKGISWPPKPDIILVSRFLPESLIWPQILAEIGPKWIWQSFICNMCGRIFPRVANLKKNTRDIFWATHNEFTISQLFSTPVSFISVKRVLLTSWPRLRPPGLLQRNESKSFGKWNPFVGWTLACPNYPISTAVRKASLVTLGSIESGLSRLLIVMQDSERCEASIWKSTGLEAVAFPLIC